MSCPRRSALPTSRTKRGNDLINLPARARAVVIGCGIVGNSVAYHLCRLGWKDVVLIDKGPLPNPGGSTGHASNFIYLVDHSKEMTALTVESVNQYREMGVFTQSGGIEVARTKERMQELARRMSSAVSWGIEPVSLITPAQVKDLVPFIDQSIIIGGFYTPGVGVVDSLRAGTIMRERAQATGALQVVPKTEVVAIDVEHGRVRCVRTTAGEIEAETVVITCGVWSPRVALMAGARIPLTPAVHQMIDVGPVPRFASAKGDIEVPMVTLGAREARRGADVDHLMHSRRERDAGAGHEGDARTPDPTRDHDRLGLDLAGRRPYAANAAVFDVDRHDLGLRHHLQGTRGLRALAHDRARAQRVDHADPRRVEAAEDDRLVDEGNEVFDLGRCDEGDRLDAPRHSCGHPARELLHPLLR